MIFRKRKILVIFLCAVIVFICKQFQVFAEENTEICIQVKATVPEDFVEPISIKYEGKNRKDNEMDLILDYEHEYMTSITVPKDLYTLKHSSTAEGYTADCMAAFTLEDAETDHTYWLSVTVNTDHGAKEDDGLLNLLVRAGFETEDYDGSDISVRYSGTQGNLIIADLNMENGYQTVVQMTKDVYTKEIVGVPEGFHAVAQYSFDVRGADSENYLLDIIVREGMGAEEADVEKVLFPEETEDSLEEMEPATEEAPNEPGNQKIVFEIANYEKAGLDDTVYVAYAGTDHVIEEELNASNQYSVILDEPYDMYEILYITCYADESLEFETSHEVIQADGSDAMIPVRIFVSNKKRDGMKNILITAVVIIIAVILYLYLKNRKNKKKKENPEDKSDSFNEALYIDDDFSSDDMELNLDDE